MTKVSSKYTCLFQASESAIIADKIRINCSQSRSMGLTQLMMLSKDDSGVAGRLGIVEVSVVSVHDEYIIVQRAFGIEDNRHPKDTDFTVEGGFLWCMPLRAYINLPLRFLRIECTD